MTSIPLVSRTRATLRNAEFGFFGVCVYTRVQTPRFCGELWSAGLAVLYVTAWHLCELVIYRRTISSLAKATLFQRAKGR